MLFFFPYHRAIPRTIITPAARLSRTPLMAGTTKRTPLSILIRTHIDAIERARRKKVNIIAIFYLCT
jgi:hypothetical protein